MAKASSQKFISRNRPPRVQIEYDVETYGSEKKVQLPFVMGVMSDLSGKPEDPLAPVADRKFLEIDIDNFDDRLKAMKPRVAFPVPNTLTGEGNLMVDITFESMDDFSPAAVARKVEPLRKLLETRTQLANLMTYMDGKSGAEELIAKVLQDKDVLAAMTSAPAPEAAEDSEAAEASEAPAEGDESDAPAAE
ncbi:MAG: type VI secretion system contractile sheath small subunit [Planctomycetota bacterium]